MLAWTHEGIQKENRKAETTYNHIFIAVNFMVETKLDDKEKPHVVSAKSILREIKPNLMGFKWSYQLGELVDIDPKNL